MSEPNFFVNHGRDILAVVQVASLCVLGLLALAWWSGRHERRSRRRAQMRELDLSPRGLGLWVRKANGHGGWEKCDTTRVVTGETSRRARVRH